MRFAGQEAPIRLKIAAGWLAATLAAVTFAWEARPAAAESAPAAVRTESITASIAPRAGASAAATGMVLKINSPGTVANRIRVFLDSAGKQVFTAPEGIDQPAGDPNCHFESATRFNCDPGYIDAIVGSMNAGSDEFHASASLPILIGAVVDGTTKNFNGGTGKDTVVGGALGDGLAGNDGSDLLKGGPGRDSLRGGDARDLLKGGAGRDALRGNGGGDWLDGGSSSDLCRGGAGTDSFRSCEAGDQ